MYAKVGRLAGLTGVNPLRSNARGELAVALGGDYRDATLGQNGFFAFQGSSAVALYTATAAIGIQIYNPVNSMVNLVLNKWAAIVWATSATMTGMVLAVANAAPAAPASPVAPDLTGKGLLTSTTGVPGACVATKTCTLLAAPVRVWNLFHNTAAINTVGAEQMSGDLQGAFAFAPGTVAVIGALGAAGVTVDLAVTWEEVPINI